MKKLERVCNASKSDSKSKFAFKSSSRTYYKVLNDKHKIMNWDRGRNETGISHLQNTTLSSRYSERKGKLYHPNLESQYRTRDVYQNAHSSIKAAEIEMPFKTSEPFSNFDRRIELSASYNYSTSRKKQINNYMETTARSNSKKSISKHR